MLAALVAATVFTGCAHHAQIRPPTITIACADANFTVDRLRWSRWSGADATATGTAHVNDCKPYCAAGHFHAYPIVVTLGKPVTCVQGRREFARIGWHFTAAKPFGKRTDAETLPCSFLKLRP